MTLNDALIFFIGICGITLIHFRGLFITINDMGHIYDILCNWTEPNVKVIVVSTIMRYLELCSAAHCSS